MTGNGEFKRMWKEIAKSCLRYCLHHVSWLLTEGELKGREVSMTCSAHTLLSAMGAQYEQCAYVTAEQTSPQYCTNQATMSHEEQMPSSDADNNIPLFA
jgi:hypothetical protein